MGKIATYNAKEVSIAFGTHICTGYADDSFVSIEPNVENITKKVGCDGEIVRSIIPDDTFNVKVTLLQTSDSSKWLQNRLGMDLKNGDAMFPIEIKDLKGGLLFSSDAAWVVQHAARGYGKESTNREWTIATGSATLSDD